MTLAQTRVCLGGESCISTSTAVKSRHHHTLRISMTKRFSTLSTLLLFSCIFSMRAQAQSSCSNASLNGNYFYQVSGVTGATGTPYAELGKFIFDGNGHVSGQSTIGSNGSIS